MHIEESDLSDAYQALARELSQHLPDGWQKYWISGEVSDDYTDLEFGYHLDVAGDQYFVPALESRNRIRDHLRNIRKQMTPPGGQPWSKCTFTLFADGTFTFDVEYDD